MSHKRLIYQVNVGKPSKLYQTCIDSVSRYCQEHGIDHVVQSTPKLWIKPDPFLTNRSKEAVDRVGCLPIFEKENAFEYLKKYDEVAVVDADIYIRERSPNIFEEFGNKHAFGAVIEALMPITPEYQRKIHNYSNMQYSQLAKEVPFSADSKNGYHFHNMGLMVFNKSLLKYLGGQNPREFITRPEFKNFVDGVGAYKWSTDQTLLNYWIRKYQVPTKNMSWKWNALYKGVRDDCLREAHFVHFFLKDKLPNRGENVEELIRNL